MPEDRATTGTGRTARFVELYSRTFIILAAVVMATIVVVMGVQVVARYVLNSSLIWAEELCRYLLILMTFLFIGVAYQRGEMVSVQYFMGLLSRRAALFVAIPVHIAIIAFLCVVSYYGYRYATLNAQFSMPAIDFIMTAILRREVSGAMSMYWIYLLIPIGCLILSAHFAVTLARIVRSAFAPAERL